MVWRLGASFRIRSAEIQISKALIGVNPRDDIIRHKTLWTRMQTFLCDRGDGDLQMNTPPKKARHGSLHIDHLSEMNFRMNQIL